MSQGSTAALMMLKAAATYRGTGAIHLTPCSRRLLDESAIKIETWWGILQAALWMISRVYSPHPLNQNPSAAVWRILIATVCF